MKKLIVATLVVVALLLTSSQWAAAQAMDPNTLSPRSGADFDLYFMRNIITNHQIDVELLRPAATNAAHAEIKALALSVMDKRQQEADQLIGWLNDWYHNQPDTSMSATLVHMKAMPSMDMGSLNEALRQVYDLQAATGDAYDRSVLIYLIHDHQLAIEAASLVASRAARPELKPFAQGLIVEQQGEIDQFSGWLAQWYRLDALGQPLPPPHNTPLSSLPPSASAVVATPNPPAAPAGQTTSGSNAPVSLASPSSDSIAALTATPVALPSASSSGSGMIILVIGAAVVLAAVTLLALLRRTPTA